MAWKLTEELLWELSPPRRQPGLSPQGLGQVPALLTASTCVPSLTPAVSVSPGRLGSGLAFVLVLLINDSGCVFPGLISIKALCAKAETILSALFVQHGYVGFSASECRRLFTASQVKIFNESNLRFKRTERRQKTQFTFQVDQSICIRCFGLRARPPSAWVCSWVFYQGTGRRPSSFNCCKGNKCMHKPDPVLQSDIRISEFSEMF